MDSSSASDLSIIENVRKQLESLKRTPDGAFLFSMVERALGRYGGPNERVEGSFFRFLNELLGRYADDPKGNPVTRVKARLIQQRIGAYLNDPSVISAANTASPAATNPPVSSAQEPVTPAGPTTAPPKPVDLPPLRAPDPTSAPPARQSGGFDSPAGGQQKVEIISRSWGEPLDAPTPQTPPTVRPPGNVVPAQVDSAQHSLVDNLSDIVLKNREVNGFLRSQLKVLKLAESGNDLMDLKHLLVRGMEDLIEGQTDLEANLANTDNVLRAAKQDNEQLKQQLQKVNKHALTDELTGLPKQEMLRKQLEAEIGRAKRYGFSLALSIIDIDDLGSINQRFGQSAGDEVLQYYAKQVLGSFRAYDVVARYGGDEFAVLFPNTQKEGAYRALEKAQKGVAGVVLNHNGQNLPLPSFSSVLTIYSTGEKPDSMLRRADEALDMAKMKGPGQVVVSLPTSS